MKQSCNTEVTTPTGKFTFHFQKLSMCQAKKFCAEKNEILAPITNKKDFDALKKAITQGNYPGCNFNVGVQQYHLGLDVTPCGKGKQDRVFTNGEVWDETVHGKLYIDNIDSWKQPCVFATLYDEIDRPVLAHWINCYQDYEKFICLKPATPVDAEVSSESCNSQSEGLTSSSNNQSFFAFGVIACLASVAVVFAFFALKYFKKYRAVEEKQAEVEKFLRLYQV